MRAYHALDSSQMPRLSRLFNLPSLGAAMGRKLPLQSPRTFTALAL